MKETQAQADDDDTLHVDTASEGEGDDQEEVHTTTTIIKTKVPVKRKRVGKPAGSKIGTGKSAKVNLPIELTSVGLITKATSNKLSPYIEILPRSLSKAAVSVASLEACELLARPHIQSVVSNWEQTIMSENFDVELYQKNGFARLGDYNIACKPVIVFTKDSAVTNVFTIDEFNSLMSLHNKILSGESSSTTSVSVSDKTREVSADGQGESS